MSSKMIYLLLLSALIFFVYSACKTDVIPVPNRTLNEDVTVSRSNNGEYTFHFSDTGTWKIFSGLDVESIDWEEPIAIVDNDNVTLKDFDQDKRYYFGILTPDNEIIVTSERQIIMNGTPNFRDIGGLPTTDNRIVKWGHLYRSSKLSDLKKRDLEYFKQLNIQTVCDFRYDSEKNKDPDRLPDSVNYIHMPIGGAENEHYEKLKKRVMKKELKGLDAKKEFTKVMSMFAEKGAADFKPVMDLILDNKNTPLLYHCSGGKDRTGFMTIILFSALGVDKETIKNDYLMSNFYRYEQNKSFIRKSRLIGMDSETISYALVVDEEYFDSFFEVIDNKYGGVENYLLVKFGLDESKLDRLREMYTFKPYEYNLLFGEEKLEELAEQE